jgi:hypothetical protein
MDTDWIMQAIANGGVMTVKRQGNSIIAFMRWEHREDRVLGQLAASAEIAIDSLNDELLDDAASEMDV